VPVDYYLGFDSLSASVTYIPIYIMKVHTNAYMNTSNNKIIKKHPMMNAIDDKDNFFYDT
jgi:hypothetical protein